MADEDVLTENTPTLILDVCVCVYWATVYGIRVYLYIYTMDCTDYLSFSVTYMASLHKFQTSR